MLRKKRERETVRVPGFPIIIRVKPTAHHQWCFLCRQEIEKGDKQFLVPSGLWTTWLPRNKEKRAKYVHEHGINFKHTDVQYAQRLPTSSEELFGILVARNLYFHADCYTCLFKRMIIKARLPFKIDVGCDGCQNRFNCFAGNISLEDAAGYAYIPSRPNSHRYGSASPRIKFEEDSFQ